MEHYQIHKACGVCGRMLIADMQSIGVSHDFIVAITCMECGVKAGGNIMESGKREEIDIGGPTLSPKLDFHD